MNNLTTEIILKAVENVRNEAKSAEYKYDSAVEIINIKSGRNINLLGGSAVSQVADIASECRQACDNLYASYQALVQVLDKECRPLLSQDPSAYAIKEVYELIFWLNSESEIGANFSGTFNGSSIGDLVGVKYIPLMENKITEKFWHAQYSALPFEEQKIADSLFRQREQKDYEAKMAAMQAKLDAERKAAEEESRKKEEEKQRRLDAEKALKEQLTLERAKFKLTDKWIAVSEKHAVVRTEDGKVKATGSNECGQCSVSSWSDIIQVECDKDLTYGLNKRGNILIAGKPSRNISTASTWKNIIQIAAGDGFLLGLDKDGNLHSTAGGLITEWKELNEIYVSDSQVIGVKKDGSAVRTNYNSYGNCEGEFAVNLGDTEILDIAAGWTGYTVLKSDGQVHCHNVRSDKPNANAINKVGGIVKVKMFLSRPLGITYEKKIAIGLAPNETLTGGSYATRLHNFTKKIDGHIVAIATSNEAYLFLTDDGKVYFYDPMNSYNSTLDNGLLFDETFCAFSDFDTVTEQIVNAEKHEREQKRLQEIKIADWKAQGLCQHCGGTFKKALFGVKCTSCGSKQDY